MKPATQQEALKKLLSTCPHCSARHEQLDSSIIHQSKEADLLHVQCRTCQGSVVALLFSTGPLISSIGLITDLLPEDVIAFQRAKPLDDDDLLAMHEWLLHPGIIADILHYRSRH